MQLGGGIESVRCVSSLGADVGILVAGVTHLAEARDEEVVAAVVRGCVLLDVGELYKLRGEEDIRHDVC